MAGSISNPPSAAVKLTKQAAYTQTYSNVVRTHAKEALSTSISLTLVSEIVPILNAQNETINELKKLVNSLIDDLQVLELAG